VIANGPLPVVNDAPAVYVPSPCPIRIDTPAGPTLPLFATARSGMPSSLKSPTAIQFAPTPAAGVDFVVNVPLPLPRRIDTVPSALFATARSIFPSLFRSAVEIPCGIPPTETEELGEVGNRVLASLAATGK